MRQLDTVQLAIRIIAPLAFLANANSSTHGDKKCYNEIASWINDNYRKDTVEKE